jgi:small-conductance mechanosensitive channel
MGCWVSWDGVQGGNEVTVQILVEALIIAVVIYVATRFFRKTAQM